MIYAIDNGETREDHRVDFIETDLTPAELAELIAIEHGPAEWQNHRWTEIPDHALKVATFAELARPYAPRAPVREIPFVIFVADVSTWAPNLEQGGFHEGSSAAGLTLTPRGAIYWLARESTALLERWAKAEATLARGELERRAGTEAHPKWTPFQPIRWELEWRATGKTCGCGIHHTARAWLELEQARFQYSPEDDEDGPELLECRHCSCGSTIARLHRLPFAYRPPTRQPMDSRRRLEQLARASGVFAVATHGPVTNTYHVHLSAIAFVEGQPLGNTVPIGDVELAAVAARIRRALWTATLAGIRLVNGADTVILWEPAARRDPRWFEEAVRHRARMDRLGGSGAFSIDSISDAMRERGVVIATAGEQLGAGHVSFRLARARTGAELGPDGWREVLEWFERNAPVALRVELSDGLYSWDSTVGGAPEPIPARPGDVRNAIDGGREVFNGDDWQPLPPHVRPV